MGVKVSGGTFSVLGIGLNWELTRRRQEGRTSCHRLP
jgi:hypothetical protein